MQQKKFFRLFSLALVVVLCLGLLAPVSALGVDITTYIEDADDLFKLAEKCRLDTYSQKVHVILQNDIDLGGQTLSIPTFGGTFSGKGHTISGLVIAGKDSTVGLFSYVQPGAVIEELTVEGRVQPGGDKAYVGGIAGKNGGTIKNCNFSGVVNGEDYVGGVAASNEATGEILACSAAGTITGTRFTGGIVGDNSGSIISCANRAAVNTTVSDEEPTEDSITDELYRLPVNTDEVEKIIPISTDTGGICGYSAGILQSCRNYGEVGYSQVGYNVGGIVGRECGYLDSCINEGLVQGRKDVGGIVGQQVPDIHLELGEDTAQRLKDNLKTLQNIIDGMLGDADSSGDTISSRLNQISNYVDQARESAHDMSDRLQEFTDENISTVNNVSALIAKYSDKASPIFDQLEDAAGNAADAGKTLSDAMDTLKHFSNCGTDALDDLSDCMDDLRDSGEYLSKGLKELSNLKSDIHLPNAEIAALTKSLDKMNASAKALSETIATARAEIAAGGAISEETRGELMTNAAAVAKSSGQVLKDTVALLRALDLQTAKKDVEAMFSTLKKAIQQFRKGYDSLDDAMEHFSDFIDDLHVLNGDVDKLSDQLKEASDSLSAAMTTAGSAMGDLEQWSSDLANEDPISFTTLGTEFSDNSQKLNSALSSISDQFSSLNTEVHGASDTLIADFRQANDQFMTVMDIFLDALDEVGTVDADDLFEDISDEYLQSATKGKVSDCINRGQVEGSLDVGGIVGTMAIEYDLDPEDDLINKDGGLLTTKMTYQTKAILMDCSNYGEINSKKNCAGSVVGRMDLGTVVGCGGYGDAAAEDGDYVGGVCGYSLSTVRDSYAKCKLSGNRYVGGIVGSGNRVTNCRSMVEIPEAESLYGAVAGEVSNVAEGNYFVSDTLAGIDRVSYSGKAEPLAYNRLLRLEGLPAEFSSFRLQFVVEDTGEVLKAVTFNYGESFDESVYPEVKAPDGDYYQWDVKDLTDLRFDTTVTATAKRFVTALSSNQTRKDGRPVFFVEGNFQNTDVLTVANMKADGQAAELGSLEDGKKSKSPGKSLEQWRLTYPKDGQETHMVRYYSQDVEPEALTIRVKEENGRWKTRHAEVMGSYLRFEVTGETAEIAVYAANRSGRVVIVLIAVLALLVVLILLTKKGILHLRAKKLSLPKKKGKKKAEKMVEAVEEVEKAEKPKQKQAEDANEEKSEKTEKSEK